MAPIHFHVSLKSVCLQQQTRASKEKEQNGRLRDLERNSFDHTLHENTPARCQSYKAGT